MLIASRPGVWSSNEVSPGTAALLDVAEIDPSDRVLDLGCGTGVIGAAAALQAPEGHAVLVDSNTLAVGCARETLRLNEIRNAEVHLADGCLDLPLESFDRVLCHLPRERAVQEELLRGAAAVLVPGGMITFVAHRRAGIRPAVDFAKELFGRCGVIRQKKGFHVALAARLEGYPYALPDPGYEAYAVAVDGVESVVVGKPGVFAWDRLDDGTRALIEAMVIQPSDRVLDMGCGTGLAGLVAARQATAGRVTLVDVDVRAVEAARRTLAANGIDNAEALVSDRGIDLPAATFDVVVTNPPFHQGVAEERTAARRFIESAARLLAAKGRLYLVANRFLTYEPWLEEAFGKVNVVWEDSRYRVWEAEGPSR